MRSAVTEEDFLIWQADPVTRWVFAAIGRAQEQERAEWMRVSWDAAPADGKTSPAALIELRTRHDALGDVTENDFETWKAWHEYQRD